MASRPRQLLSRPERQASVLRAAATAFSRTGFAQTSMEDVAAEAGITRLIVYRHFGSKEELYRAVLGRVTDQLAMALADAPRRAGASPIVAPVLRVARDDPDGFRLLWVHAQREPRFAAYAAEQRQLAVRYAEAVVDRARVPDPVIRRWATEVLVTTTIETVLEWLDHGDPDRDDEFVTIAGRSLRAMVQAIRGR